MSAELEFVFICEMIALAFIAGMIAWEGIFEE